MSDADLIRTWRSLLERYHTATCALERALNDEHQLGMSEFEVLDRLMELEAEGCRDAGRRVQELATSLHLSQSALSRVIARLERDGLVARGMCPNDRRGIFVHLTDAGRTRHAHALPTQRAVLAAQFAAAPSSDRGRAGSRTAEPTPARDHGQAPLKTRTETKTSSRSAGKTAGRANSSARRPRAT